MPIRPICIALVLAAMLFAIPAFAQPKSAFCPAAEPDTDVLLTICTRERGMVVTPQPNLYIRIHNDGRAEYETTRGTNPALLTKSLTIPSEDLAEISTLISDPEFQKANAEYPRFHIWDDSSMVTTITVRNGASAKTIIVNNYGPEDPDNKQHYPKPLIKLMMRAQEMREKAMGIVRQIPNISFCELVKNPERYLDKTVEVYADIEYAVAILATGERRNEHEFLYDVDCDSQGMADLRTKESVRVGYIGKPDDIMRMRSVTNRIRGLDFGGRGKATFQGKLQQIDKPVPYGPSLRFDISSVKQLERLVLTYQGEIKLGWFSSATIVGGQPLALSSPLKMPFHHVGRIDWRNVEKFPILKQKGLRAIIFRAQSETTQMVGKGRWDSVYQCEIEEAK